MSIVYYDSSNQILDFGKDIYEKQNSLEAISFADKALEYEIIQFYQILTSYLSRVSNKANEIRSILNQMDTIRVDFDTKYPEEIGDTEEDLELYYGEKYKKDFEEYIASFDKAMEKEEALRKENTKDVNELLETIYYAAHYCVNAYEFSYDYHSFMMFNNFKYSGAWSNFNVNFFFKVLVEAIFQLYIAMYAFKLNNYRWALKKYVEAKSISNMVDIDEAISQNDAIRGKKGGNKKGENYLQIQEKALTHHDKYYGTKNSNNKFEYSASKAALKIIVDLKLTGYEPTSLANIIRKHRKKKNFSSKIKF